MLTRRVLLKGSAVAMAGMGAAPGWLARAAETSYGKRKILVAIFQRGAADGLNIVVPFTEKRYYQMRPTIAVAAPGGQTAGSGPFGQAIDLDGRFGLNPALEALKPFWDKQQLAIVEATGSPDPSRSHFDAQDYMESGTPGKATGDGWLNRALPAPGPDTSPLRAIAMGSQLPRTLRGESAAIAVNNPQQFQLANSGMAGILESMYSATGDARLARTGKDAFAAMKMIRMVNQQPYTPAPGVQYAQGGELGRNLQQIARMIKANIGVEAAFARAGRLGSPENGTAGTDHGHGNVMMVLGGGVAGGKVYGQWPGLEKEQLNEGRDLAVTTDFRAVLSELVSGQLGQKDLSRVFPGFQAGTPLGLLRG